MTLDCSYRQRLSENGGQRTKDGYWLLRPLFSVLRPPSAQPRAGARRRRRLLLKTSFASNTSRRLAVKQSPTTEMPLAGRRNRDDGEQTESALRQSTATQHRLNVFPLHDIKERRTEDRRRITVDSFPPFPASARRFHAPCKLKTLKDFSPPAAQRLIRPLSSVIRPPNGGARRDRTDDLMLAKHALSQLSYSPAGGHPSSVVRLPSSDPGGPGRT